MKISILLTVLLSFFSQQVYCTSKADLLAQAEVTTWKAYYARDFTLLSTHLQKIFEIQFDLSSDQAQEVTNLYVEAAAYFAFFPHDTTRAEYQQKVLPILTEAYAVLNSFSPIQDFEKAAYYDLEWWIDRRDPSRNTPAIVGCSMAHMYAALNADINPNDLQRAGYLRAVAAQYRDLSQSKWGGITPEDWTIIEQILNHSYQILAN